MAKRGVPAQLRNAELSRDELEQGIARLRKRLEEVEALDIAEIRSQFDNPALDRLRASVDDGLTRTFGNDTVEYRRYAPAATFSTGPIYINQDAPLARVQQSVAASKERSKALLGQAIDSLSEQYGEIPHLEESSAVSPQAKQERSLSRRVFVVHGHDEGAREMVARFLERLRFEAIILHEQASRGRTVIEKVETHGDVSFAVVLMTPDDVGSAVGGELRPRVRQNVLLELGYFIGRLGRTNVCALKRGDPDVPSDFTGVVWQDLDENGGWRIGLARELQAVGHDIDWNDVMRG